MVDIVERIARAEARLDSHGMRLDELRVGHHRLELQLERINQRVTKVAVRIAFMTGGAAAVGGLIGTVVGWLFLQHG